MLKRILRSCFFIVVYSYLYIPLSLLVINSFNSARFGREWNRFTLEWYARLLKNDSLIQAAWHSLTVAAISATAATSIGFLTALAVYRYKFRFKGVIRALLFIVMISPDIVLATSFLALFILTHIPLGFWSLLIAHITFSLPFVVLTVSSRFEGFDSKLLEAAKDLGASDYTILKKIILPLTFPAILGSWLLSFTLSIDDVVVSTFVTGPTYEILPLKIYSMVRSGISPEVNALATLMLLFSLMMVIGSQLVARKPSQT